MIEDMLSLYLKTTIKHNIEIRPDSRGRIERRCTCPICGEHSFDIHGNAKYGSCLNCGTFWMEDFCRKVLHLDGEDMIKLIIEKEKGEVNQWDLQAFARCVHPRILEPCSIGDKIVFDCPEDRVALEACPVCGCKFFAYHVKRNSVTARCLYCEEYIDGIKKEKNIKSGKRSTQASKWAAKVAERYNNKCALCYSTDELDAHHIIPWSICEDQRYNIDNGILLCKKHHELAHKMVPMGNRYPIPKKDGAQ